MRWHFWLTPAAEGAYNMALDEALMLRAARTGDAVLRVYSWSAPTLSLGRNQRARGCYDEMAASDLGIGFVRRPTGGRALLHHREVTYSVTMPVTDSRAGGAAGAGAGSPRAAYTFINHVLLGALRALGVPATMATQTASMSPGLRPCFDVPAEHEIVARGRKLVGSAQWRQDGALLQHGSILVQDDQPLIARLMNRPAADEEVGGSEATTLFEHLGWAPTAEAFAPCLLESLEMAIGNPVPAMESEAGVEADAERLRPLYMEDSWTWRR